MRFRQLVLLVVEAAFLIIVWLPNLAAIYSFGPYLFNSDQLKAHLLFPPGLFADAAKYYATAQIASVSPNQIWDLKCSATLV